MSDGRNQTIRAGVAVAEPENKRSQRFEVTVLYNGVRKHFEVIRDELVQRLLDQARQAFGPIPNPHLLGLFTRGGVELKDNETVAVNRIQPNEELLLRPSAVRGGACP